MIKCTYCSKFSFLRHIQICILSFSWILFDGLVVGGSVCKDVSVQPASQHICIIFYHLNLLIYVNVSKILLWSNEESTYVSSRMVSCPLDKKYPQKPAPAVRGGWRCDGYTYNQIISIFSRDLTDHARDWKQLFEFTKYSLLLSKPLSCCTKDCISITKMWSIWQGYRWEAFVEYVQNKI